MGDVEHFRIFFWQRLVPLVTLPVFAFLFFASPATDGWSRPAWVAFGALAGMGLVAYLGNAWAKSDVQLDDTGLTVWLAARETWPYEKLLHVKQFGKYRVRMCFDRGIPDEHMHITVDLWDADGFVDELLDRYAETQGHELPEPPAQQAQSAA